MKRYVGIIVLGVAIIIGLIYVNVDRSSSKDMVHSPEEAVSLEEPVEAVAAEEEIESSPLMIIDVKGAVTSPGIYEMKEGDRIHDLINQAGGFTKEANEAEINLAQRLQDEMVIIIPKEGEILEEISSVSTATSSNTMAESAGDKIKLNDATQTELETLNGIGPSKAQAIIDYREENGAFQSVEDVLQVNGIGEKTLENFKDDIIVP